MVFSYTSLEKNSAMCSISSHGMREHHISPFIYLFLMKFEASMWMVWFINAIFL